MTRRTPWTLRWPVVLAAVALALPATWSVAAVPTSGLEVTRKTLRSGKGLAIEADAGRLLVPENRANPRSRAIAIGFLRLKSTAKSPRAPLVYLAGGPGSRSVSESPRALDFWTPFLATADVLLIDQRGTNDSSLVWRWDGPPPLAFFLHADSALAHEERMGRRALAAFRGRGVDLAGYTTVESATDLDQVRAALRMERVSLLGFSYGTHLAIAYMRRHPDRVADAVLLGIEGPD